MQPYPRTYAQQPRAPVPIQPVPHGTPRGRQGMVPVPMPPPQSMPPNHQAVPPNPQMLAAAQAAQAQRNAAATAAMNMAANARRSRRPTDKHLPDAIDSVIIGDGAKQYRKLKDVERRLDAAMVKKRLDVQDSVNKHSKRLKTLRVWVSTYAENQPWQRDDSSARDEGNGGGGGRFRMRIEGKLLDEDTLSDDEEDSDGEDGSGSGDQSGNATTKKAGDGEAMDVDESEPNKPEKKRKRSTAPHRTRLSHFFRAISVDFDPSPAARHPSVDSQPIIWLKPPVAPNEPLPAAADFDSFEFSRNSEVELNVTISFTRDESQERYKLSPQLAAVLDTQEETRAGIIIGLYDYIKAMGLQENEERRSIRCDDLLQQVFHREKIFFPMIPEAVAMHTLPADPVRIPFKIHVDREHTESAKPEIYDINVAREDPIRLKLSHILSSPRYPEMLHNVAALDDRLALIVQSIVQSKGKHAFFASFSEDPATFIKRWMSSQRRDLGKILGEGLHGDGDGANGPEFRRGGGDGAWDTQVAREAVRYLLAKPTPRVR